MTENWRYQRKCKTCGTRVVSARCLGIPESFCARFERRAAFMDYPLPICDDCFYFAETDAEKLREWYDLADERPPCDHQLH